MEKTITPDEAKVLTQKLVQTFENLAQKHAFKPKQLVRWKQGLKNKGVPEYNEPAIVWQVLPEPHFDTANAQRAGTSYYHEPLDLVLAVMDKDDNFVMHYYNSRRFEPIY
jgi:hypothetical protein